MNAFVIYVTPNTLSVLYLRYFAISSFNTFLQNTIHHTQKRLS